MKKLLPTFILVVLVVSGFLYAKQQNFFREEEAKGEVVMEASGDQVEAIKLTQGDAVIELERDGDGWKMLAPEEYPVESYQAQTLAEGLQNISIKGVIADNPADPGEYGLEKPVRSLELALRDGRTLKLDIGNPLPVAGTTYIRLGGSPIVYEAEDYVINPINKTVLDLVDKSVLKLKYNQVTEVHLEWKGETIQLTKADPVLQAYEAPWKLGSLDLKPEEGSGLLDKLVYLSTDRLPKERTELSWEQPNLTITVQQQEDGNIETLNYIGQLEGDRIWIAEASGQWAYSAAVSDLDSMMERVKELQTLPASE